MRDILDVQINSIYLSTSKFFCKYWTFAVDGWPESTHSFLLLHGKNGFAEISKNLTRSKKNYFVK